MGIMNKMLPLLGVLLWFGTAQLWAQDETPAEKAYREDFEQFEKIKAEKDPIKRADEILAFMQQRPQSKIQPYAQADYMFILENIGKAEKWDSLVTMADRFVKIRPRVGETYFYLGLAFNAQKKFDEAMTALAKCYLLKNTGSLRAKNILDAVWKGRHQQKIDGLDAFIAKVRSEIGG